MKKKLIVLVMLLTIPFLAMSQEPRFSFLSLKNFYFYSMGTWVFDVPPGYHQEGWVTHRADAFSSIGGIGYTVFNYKDKALIHLEFDYMSAKFDFSSTLTREVKFSNFMASLEYRFVSGLPISVYLGFGVGDIRYSGLSKYYRPGDPYVYYNNENDYRGITSLGLKIGVAKRLDIRTELRYFWENSGTDYYGYGGHLYGYGGYGSDPQKFAGAFGMGIEYRFRSNR